jgi:Domain of unknown function (DUF3883)
VGFGHRRRSAPHVCGSGRQEEHAVPSGRAPQRRDRSSHQDIGRYADEKERSLEGAAGRLAIAIEKHDKLCRRRDQRREELERQRAFSLQAVERISSALVLPHPERGKPELRSFRPNPETEQTAMCVAMDNERAASRAVADVHEKDLGYDLTSLDTQSGELRLMEVKGVAASEGPIIITPNEHRVAEDRRDCYWLYVVTDCATDQPKLYYYRDPSRFGWQEVKKVAHYQLPLGSMPPPDEDPGGGPSMGEIHP